MRGETGRAIVPPKGYIPMPFEPPMVRRLYDLRNDHTTDLNTWMDDLMATLKEIEMPAEELYEQEEELRMLKFNIDQLPEDSENREYMEGELERLINRYSRERVEADERAEEAFVKEVKQHYYEGLNILDENYKPVDPDLTLFSLSEEELLKTYQPAPYEKQQIKDQDELREEFEDEDGYEVDEYEWAKQMQDAVTEEIMPYSLVYGHMEHMRKLQHQIDVLDSDPLVAEMTEPYEPVEIEEDLLTPEQLEIAKRDQLHKIELNKKFEKRRSLEIDLEDYAELVANDFVDYQDQIDERMEEEIAKREESLEKHREEKELAKQLAEEQRKLEEQEREEQVRREALERERLKEERRFKAEQDLAALEERNRQAAREQEERDRRREEYERELRGNLNLVMGGKDYLEALRRQEAERIREEEFEKFRAEQEARMREKIDKNPREIEEDIEDEKIIVQGNAGDQAQPDGTGLDEILAGGEVVNAIDNSGDIDLGRASDMTGMFEKKPDANGIVVDAQDLAGDIDLGGGDGGDFFETMPKEEDNKEIPNLGDLLGEENEEAPQEGQKEGEIEENKASKFLDLKSVEEVLSPEEMKEYMELLKEEKTEKNADNIENDDSYELDEEEQREIELLIEKENNPYSNAPQQNDIIVPDKENDRIINDHKENAQKINEQKIIIPDVEPAVTARTHLNEEQLYYLDHSEKFDAQAEMFDTKKRFRWLGNTTSKQYDRAQEAYHEFLRVKREAKQQLDALEEQYSKGDLTDDKFRDGCKQIGTSLDRASTTLYEKMKEYAVHATNGRDGELGDKKITDMTQDTGAARLAGALNTLDMINKARYENGGGMIVISDTRAKERVNETKFADLYSKHFGEISKESNRHRRAAAKAQDEIKREQQKEKQKEQPIKRS